MNWTDPQKEILSRLWMEGMSANQIASVLGEGITRNAVIGKAHRLGLSGGDREGSRSDTAATAAAPDLAELSSDQAVAAQAAPETSGVKDSGIRIATKPKAHVHTAVTIAELLEGMCRWPAEETDSATFRYCGLPTEGGAPYCAGHCKLAYQPTKPIRRRPDRNSLFPGIVIGAPKG
jgi:GcrA cell cycle regulator